MRFSITFPAIIGLIFGTALTTFALAGTGATSTAYAFESSVTSGDLEEAIRSYATGSEPPAQVRSYVLNATRRYAVQAQCGFDVYGNRLTEEGEWYEAHMVGEVANAPSSSERKAAQRTLSRHNGFCYLAVTKDTGRYDVAYPSSARSGAIKRTALALSQMTKTTVTVVVGSKTTSYDYRTAR